MSTLHGLNLRNRYESNFTATPTVLATGSLIPVTIFSIYLFFNLKMFNLIKKEKHKKHTTFRVT